MNPLPTSDEVPRRRLRLGLVDDHPLFRQGLIDLLEEEFDVVWQASSTREAQEAATQKFADVILMDLSMPGISGIEATRALLKRNPDTRVLVLTMHSGEEFVVQAFLAGATGFALKSQTIAEVAEAVRLTAEGKLYLAASIPRASLDEYNRRIRNAVVNPLDTFSPRERQVFELAVQNKSNREIAAELGITTKTVESHRLRVHKKLGVHSVADLVRWAHLNGMIHR